MNFILQDLAIGCPASTTGTRWVAALDEVVLRIGGVEKLTMKSSRKNQRTVSLRGDPVFGIAPQPIGLPWLRTAWRSAYLDNPVEEDVLEEALVNQLHEIVASLGSMIPIHLQHDRPRRGVQLDVAKAACWRSGVRHPSTVGWSTVRRGRVCQGGNGR